MRVSGETTTALLPMRFACTAAEIAAGDDPYITTSVSIANAANAHPAASRNTLFIFLLHLIIPMSTPH